jgi:3-oxoacyl-[acyl-carrier protein] reductase
MDLQLSGKRTLVTAASSGIGRAIAITLGREGVAVAVHGRDAGRTEETANAIVKDGGRADVAIGDLTTEQGANSVISSAQSALGAVDILVNVTGGVLRDGWRTTTADDWLETFNLNVVSAVRLINAFVPTMRDQAWGRIIQIGSTAGSNPPAGMALYGSVKAALANLTVSLAKDLADAGVTANIVSPGPTLTEGWRRFAVNFALAQGLGDDFEASRTALLAGPLKTPSNRLAEPEEVAALVALVASPLSGSINGADALRSHSATNSARSQNRMTAPSGHQSALVEGCDPDRVSLMIGEDQISGICAFARSTNVLTFGVR